MCLSGICRCFTTDSLPRGYPGQYVRASVYAELDGLTQETADLSWFRPSIVDRVITLRPVGLSLLRWIDCQELCRTIVLLLPQEPCPPLYSQEARALVGLQ